MANLTETLKKLLGMADGEETARRPVWKKLNILLMAAAAGILLIVLANAFTPGSGIANRSGGTETADKREDAAAVQDAPADVIKLENLLGQRLEEVLTEIDGVGKVSVTVNLASTTERDYAVNTSTNNKTTRENDNKGGNRTITEINEDGQMVLVRESQGSREQPVVVKEIKPEVKGVMVVAEGAEDPAVKADLMNAVHVYLDVPLYRVIVLSRESR